MEDEGEEEFELDDVSDDGEVSGELDGAEGGNSTEEEIADTVLDIDAKLDELLAKFDEIMGGDDEVAGDEFDGEEGGEFDGGAEAGFGGEEEALAESDDKEEEEEEEESAEPKGKKVEEGRKSGPELMREYVDTIGNIYGGQGDANEGDAVGSAGKKTPINTKAVKGPGADFGGNPVKTKGQEGNPDGKPVPKASNEYTKGQGEIKSGNVNVPGGKAGAPKTTGHEYTKDAKGAEGKTTSGTVPVAKKSVQAQNTGRK
jgi:hypothetical protein